MEPSSSSSDPEKIGEVIGEEGLGIDLFRAAKDGNVTIFDESYLSDEQFFKESVDDNNILHIAIRYQQEEFVRAFLEKYFSIKKKLITEKTSHGDTPLHVAAEVGYLGIVELLYDYLEMSVEDDEEKPWMAQNSMGNTALHVALLYGKYSVAEFLVKRDGGLARIINYSEEAPLHLAITHLDDEIDCPTMTSILLEKARSVATWRDGKGFTPLFRAAFLHPVFILQVTKNIIDVCPESTLVCDHSGKSFLHLLIPKLFDHNDIEDLICLKEISIYKDHQDQDGNTPLHIAAKCQNIRMVRSLQSKCSANPFIKNRDGISARSMIEQLNLSHQVQEPRTMTIEESSLANKGEIVLLLERKRTIGIDFYGSQNSEGRNFLHLFMSKTTEHHYLSSSDDRRKFIEFIHSALGYFPKLVCQKDQNGNTPLHILAQNKDFCKTLADPTLGDPSLLTELLSMCAKAGNHDLPWVMQNADGNTPLHEAIIANNKVLVLQLLSYSGEESARLVNKLKETPLHLLAGTSIGMEEFTDEEIMTLVEAYCEAIGLLDKDGLTPLSRALEAKNLNLVITLLCNVQEFCDTNGQTLWQLFLKNKLNNFLDDLLQNETFRERLKQKDKNGNTPLHLAMKERNFDFVEKILETCGGKQEIYEGEQLTSNEWLMDLLRILNNDGLTPIVSALKSDNLVLATKLCFVSPEAASIGDVDGKTIWHLLPKHPSYNSQIVRDLFQKQELRDLLKQKDKDGNTSLLLAIKEECFGFVQDLLATQSERNFSMGNQWLMGCLLRTPNNIGETPEDLIADLPTLPQELEEIFLADPSLRGIRSSWRIPRSELKKYTESLNVIASLQTTITFTAAFAVPGGLIQDVGTPTLVRLIAFQVFMISDIIAMCLSLMYLICLVWMGPANKREFVIIHDFATSLLLASLVATLLAFMSGVYATIYLVKPWIAFTTLALCSLVMLLFPRCMLTKLLHLFKYHNGRSVKNMFSWLAGSSNTQEQRSDLAF